jgi:uncharacterized membrane protein YhaH (DUF805 family)
MFGLGILEIMVIAFLIIFIFLTVVWMRALIDVLKSEFKDNNKLIWLLTVILVPFIGAIVYFAIGKKQKITK